jgi:hypothetical protein
VTIPLPTMMSEGPREAKRAQGLYSYVAAEGTDDGEGSRLHERRCRITLLIMTTRLEKGSLYPS